MPIQPPPTSAGDLATQSSRDTDYYRRVLQEMINIGTKLARALEASGRPPAEVAAGIARIARSNRLTAALIQQLDDPVPARPTRLASKRGAAARKRIFRDVEDAIEQCELEDYDEEERLDDELLDLEDEIDNRSVAEIIADISRDLGVGAIRGRQPRCNRGTQSAPAEQPKRRFRLIVNPDRG